MTVFLITVAVVSTVGTIATFLHARRADGDAQPFPIGHWAGRAIDSGRRGPDTDRIDDELVTLWLRRRDELERRTEQQG
ncbi:MAG: hypothetical protein QM662_16845 [Gordonia sp. (in: high G+C Gram-positive bacteria)]